MVTGQTVSNIFVVFWSKFLLKFVVNRYAPVAQLDRVTASEADTHIQKWSRGKRSVTFCRVLVEIFVKICRKPLRTCSSAG